MTKRRADPTAGHLRPTLAYFPLITMMRGVIQAVLFGGHLVVEGRENVPRHGGLLVISNHIAGADPPLLGASFPRPLHFMAKVEWFKNPVQGFFGRALLCFPVIRHTADRSALRFTLSLLDAGEAVCLYPEGTRSRDLKLHPPEAGAGFLARRAGVPILPVATWGGEDVLPTGAKFPRRTGTEVHLVFGKPFTLPDGTVDNQEAAEYMMSRVAEMLPAAYRGYFQDWQPGTSGRHRRLRSSTEARTA
ncbi:MAG TPA: lysophospholipid acyltransferase family protein [Candidatus Dormibacteraeota bacterium]|nr:lysophospholipid acyltransferase family protein [Candidatus Dormibacteraeota bacterium]